MKKFIWGTAVLAVILACVSCASSPAERENIEAVARKVIEAEYYRMQFRAFKAPSMLPDPNRTYVAPTQSDSFSGPQNLNPMGPRTGLRPNVLSTADGGDFFANLFTKRDYYERSSLSGVGRGDFYSKPSWLQEEAPAEQDIDRSIAAYEEALKMEPSGYWQISEDDPRWMGVPLGGVQYWLEEAKADKAEWIATGKPARERENAAISAALAVKQALESPNPNPNSENDFDIEQNAEGGITITKYRGARLYVVIPQTISGIPVTRIGAGAFGGLDGYQRRLREQSIRGVVFPDTVTYIDGFQGNKDLTSVVIPNSVTEIGHGTFQGCGLTSVTLSNRLETIGENAFEGNQLTSLEFLPPSLKTIGASAFRNNKIENLVIPNYPNLVTIGDYAFADNPLKSIVLPEILTRESTWVLDVTYEDFLDYFSKTCDNVTSITIPANMEPYHYGPSFFGFQENNFITYYESQGKRAGTYTWNGRIWTVR